MMAKIQAALGTTLIVVAIMFAVPPVAWAFMVWADWWRYAP
jgi:hypothetical protein